MHLPRGNRIIDRIVTSNAQGMLAGAEVVTLCPAQVTTMYSRVMRTVDFPVTALFSIVGALPDGSSVEITTVGSEGFVEIDAALRHDVALRTSVCRFPGTAIRLPLRDFQRSLDAEPEFADAVYHSIRARAFVTEQLALCGARHNTQQRLARWLLLTQLKLASHEFRITHSELADTLGIRRASASVSAKYLQDVGAVRYARGRMTIVDTALLEDLACECYGECRAALGELL